MKNNPIKSHLGPSGRYLKILVSLWLLALAFSLSGLQAQTIQPLPVYEPFAYVDSENLGTTGSSGTNWSWGNTPSASSARVTNIASLSFPGMPVDPTALPLGLQSGTGTGKNRGANISPITNTTVYASFMLNLRSNAITAADRIFFSLNSATSGTGVAGNPGVWLDPNGRLKISKNSGTVALPGTTYALVASNTYLVVVRYKVNTVSASDDQVDLWLNPTPMGDNANIPASDLSATNGNDAAIFRSMAFGAPSGSTPTPSFFMDEIRVSTNWADVTATNSIAGNIYSVTGGGSGCAGGTFPVGLTGSDSGVVYLLYTNGVASGQSAGGTGSAISFGLQGGSGVYTVLASNTTSTAVSWMSSKALITVITPPLITSQPVSALAATNSTVVYNLSASGLNLNYQWYRNGSPLADGGNISGVTTPILTISPVTSADAATTVTGYYCVITNSPCGYEARSITNALTIQVAGNLVWQGTPTNFWDINTTANWTNSIGVAVTFHAGDNVTLDDSFLNPILSLASPYLSPGVISYIGTQNMGISGGGDIYGVQSSLLANGTGTLSVSNANDFAGGTIISNGTVSIGTYTHPLGYGPITLAGGKFQVPIAATSSGIQLSNTIAIIANSTLEYDGGGGNAFNFGGALNGSPGVTLTVFNNNIAATLNWIRLLKGFTNNAAIALTSPGAAIEVAPVLNGGDQIFNGVISGNVGRIRTGGGSGSVILNAQNTFNDSGTFAPSGISLFMSGGNGNAGFGADSVSTTPPTIDSSPAGTGNIAINVGSDGGNCGFFASGGAHVVGNPIIYTSATNSVTVSIIGNNNLTLSGTINLSGADATGNTNRIFSVTNTGLTTFSGVISDSGLSCGLIKTGNGTLALSAVNTYTGPTLVGGGSLWVNGQGNAGGVTVTNGSIGGTGTILGAVSVNAPGAIAPGAASIGTLTLSGNLTLAGNGIFRLNKSLAQSNDIASVAGTLANSGTGTITVTNVGLPALAVGNKFFLFNKAVNNGAALSVVGGSANWTNRLDIDGSIQVLSLISGVATNATNITWSVGGGNLTISWPQDHTGWTLQTQTNSLNVGLSNNWTDVAGSTTTNQVILPINTPKGATFFRLKL